MSTLKVNNLQDASGGNSSTAEQIAQGRAKAWVNFNGTGTVAIRDNFNVSSITDNGTGDYTVNFSNALGSSDYCTLCECSDPGTANRGTNIKTDTTPTASLVRVSSATQYTTVVDPEIYCVAIFGD